MVRRGNRTQLAASMVAHSSAQLSAASLSKPNVLAVASHRHHHGDEARHKRPREDSGQSCRTCCRRLSISDPGVRLADKGECGHESKSEDGAERQVICDPTQKPSAGGWAMECDQYQEDRGSRQRTHLRPRAATTDESGCGCDSSEYKRRPIDALWMLPLEDLRIFTGHGGTVPTGSCLRVGSTNLCGDLTDLPLPARGVLPPWVGCSPKVIVTGRSRARIAAWRGRSPR